MIWPGFCGPAYRLESPYAACDRAINVYLETIEQGPRAGQLRLRGIPGLKSYKPVGQGPIRALWSNEFRLFAISGDELYEVFDGIIPNELIGRVGADAHPAFITSNGFQLAMTSAGAAYIAPGGGAGVVPITDTLGAPIDGLSIAFQDQYFIAGIINSKRLMVSDLAPAGGTWDPGNVAIKEGYSDNLVRVWVDQPGGTYLWLFGHETTEIWANTAGPFPFSRVQNQVYPIGCDSTWSVAGARGYRAWVWRAMVWGCAGFQPDRISDFAVEEAIASYSHYDQHNCEAMAWVDGGHTFYAVSFPEAGKTWVYDASVKAWHERAYFSNGQYSRYRPRVYANFKGKHLVGDYDGNQIYEMDSNTYKDARGGVLRRERIAPWITSEMNNVRYNRFTLDMQTGIGLDVGEAIQGYDPRVILKYSPDRGNTWSAERPQSAGKLGEFEKRVFWTQLGSSRIGLTVSTVMTDPAPFNINAAYLDISGGVTPRQAAA